MSKSVLVIDTPEHGCISCLIGRITVTVWKPAFIAQSRENACLMKKQKPFPIGVHLWIYQKKTMETIRLTRLMLALQRDGISALMRLQEEWINGMCKEM